MAATPASVLKTSQEIIDRFWKTSIAPKKPPTKALSVLPSNVYARKVAQHMPKGDVAGRCVTASYDEAVKFCEDKVAQIVAECKRNNLKYSDVHFDLDNMYDCLWPLEADPDPTSDDVESPEEISSEVTQKARSSGKQISWGNIQPDQPDGTAPTSSGPACAKRVGDVFEDPQFFIDGANVKDVRQGSEGDCWFLSSLSSLCTEQENSHFIERICPSKARNEQVGVYGFVFNRDGEWISEIIDDKLYISNPDYDDCDDNRRAVWDRAHSRLDPEVSRDGYRKQFQTGSDALHYGSCADQNETWLPLLEKAFAKAHGDFGAINGGYQGEGIEDLTGGISTTIVPSDVLDKDRLWTEGFMNVNKEFLFGAGSGNFAAWDGGNGRQGIEDGHAYSVLRTAQYQHHRLLLVKNPWGCAEWNGPWSDGSSEWTPVSAARCVAVPQSWTSVHIQYNDCLDISSDFTWKVYTKADKNPQHALQSLNHTFGNDGIFWISYKDFMRRYDTIWRTRLFTPEWNVTQKWTTLDVPWAGDYNDTKFEVILPEATTAVIVLSKLDERYFDGLKGQYSFELAFRLHKAGEDIHIVRGYSTGDRSAATEVELEAGTYEVLLQIQGSRDSNAFKVEDVIKSNWLDRREKLLRIGLSYDLAHAKGYIEASEESTDELSNPAAATPAEAPLTTKVAEMPLPTRGEAKKKSPKKSVSAAEPRQGETSANVEAEVEAEDESKDKAKETDAEPAAVTVADAATVDEDEDDDEVTPWQATCVVGLRVFCHRTVATVRIRGPDNGTHAAKLDVDDAEKDALRRAEKEDETEEGDGEEYEGQAEEDGAGGE